MKTPWGSKLYTTGAWDNSVMTLTVPSITGEVSDIEIVAVMNLTSSSYQPTFTGDGNAFTQITTFATGTQYVNIWARILTNTTSHSISATGAWSTGGIQYKRMSVYIVSNPMKISVTDLSSMWVVRQYQGTGGNGLTTSFADCSSLKILGGSRLDIGVAWRQYNTDSGFQSGVSNPSLSFDAANVNGLSNSPFYVASNGNNYTYTVDATTSRTVEDIGRYNNSVSSGNGWGDGGFGTIPYYNKCLNSRVPNTYPQLTSFLGAISFVIPNYSSMQMVL